MKSLLRPAIYLMGRFRFPVKFGLIFVVVLVPIIVLSVNMITSISKDITFLENERTGLAYLKVARLPIEHIQQHRGMTAAYLNGAKEFHSNIMEKRSVVDKYLAELTAVDAKLGEAMKTTGKVSGLKSQWENIKANSLNQQAGDAIKAHSQLVTDILALMVHVADSSEITLDPALDTYYMGAAIVSGLPNLVENMGQARAVGSGVAAKGEFTPKAYTRLSVLVNNIRTYNQSLNAGLDAAFDANPALAKELGTQVAGNKKAVAEIIDMLQHKLLDAEKISIESKTVFDTATHAISGSYKLFDTLIPTMDQLLINRVDADVTLEIIEISIVIAVLTIVFFLFAGLYFSVAENIEKIGHATKQVADGDLKVRIKLDTKDEMQNIATDFNDMTEKVEALVQQIMSATAQLAAAAEELSAVASDSGRNIANQTSEIDQVATAMNEMAATVQEVANNATQAAGAATNADNEAKGGKQIVTQTAQAIQELADNVEESAKVIHQLEQDSENIGTVLDVIKGIAEQTNLLALNAAIEAARAGEQGRGFAVVADEVRTLASRTQESTDEIQAMIEKLQAGSRNAVSAMENGRAKAQSGAEQAREAAESLEAITRAVTTISEMNTMIASAAEEQTSVANEMNESIVKINQLGQSTSSGAEQTSSSSQEMSNLATQLQTLVAQFKV